MKPGEILPGSGDIPLNPGAETIEVTVDNTGDRPVQVGSHYHFAAVNPALKFDRAVAWGFRLNIPAGTAKRFEPRRYGPVELVRMGGDRVVPGLRPEYAGELDDRGADPTPYEYGAKGEGPAR